jgi:hypothetical protein
MCFLLFTRHHCINFCYVVLTCHVALFDQTLSSNEAAMTLIFLQWYITSNIPEMCFQLWKPDQFIRETSFRCSSSNRTKYQNQLAYILSEVLSWLLEKTWCEEPSLTLIRNVVQSLNRSHTLATWLWYCKLTSVSTRMLKILRVLSIKSSCQRLYAYAQDLPNITFIS